MSSFHFIPADDISEHFGISIEELKTKSYNELEQLEKQMNQEKYQADVKLRQTDLNFKRIVLTHYKMLPLMLRYWSLDNCLTAIANHVTERDIITECPVSNPQSCEYYKTRYPYLGEKWASIPQFDNHGRELMERKRCICSIFETPNPYQHLRHGEPFKELLLQTYPELQAFESNIYGLHDSSSLDDYEIYIHAGTSWYTPIKALMNADPEAIRQRTLTYAKSYSNDMYQKVLQALNSEEARAFFSTVQNMPPTPAKSDEEVKAIIEHALKDLPKPQPYSVK